MSSTVRGPRISRTYSLARPKPYDPDFREDKPSVYWTDYEPFSPGANGSTEFNVSQRVNQLARHKQLLPLYKPPRPTIWPVKKEAQEATASERVEFLSRSKSLPAEYSMDRSPYMRVRPEAMKATPSARIESLAKPKHREDHVSIIQEKYWGQYVPVPKAVLYARENPYLDHLAEPKRIPLAFKGARSIDWPVGESALKAIASFRLQQLSRPRSRVLIKNDYDPYQMSPAAVRAKPTPRLEELSRPLPRNIKQKKVF